MKTRPVLSVVVAIVSDTTGNPNIIHLRPCLRALASQTNGPPLEVIVPYHPGVEGIDELRGEFPEVKFLKTADLRTYTGASGNREHHDELRARGLAEVTGELVAL